MNLDGARNAKAEIFADAFDFRQIATAQTADEGPIFAPRKDTDAYRQIIEAKRERRSDPRQLIALGILAPAGHNRNPEDLRPGIFVQQKRLIQHPIVEQAQRAARGDAKVIFTGPVRKHAPANAGRCRPLRIGASIGHHRVTAGTLGCFAVVRTGGGVGVLSNNHVLANTDRGAPGDIILQPGKADGGHRKDPASHIATLHKVVPIDFQPGAVNYVDCAFAFLMDGVARETALVGDSSHEASYWPMQSHDEAIEILDNVKKVGRTTGFTEGVVNATEIDNLEVAMSFGTDRKVARFDRQISVVGKSSAFSKPGDSGSLIFNNQNRPVALLFAGSESGGRDGHGITYANPIRTVLDALDIDIYAGA